MWQMYNVADVQLQSSHRQQAVVATQLHVAVRTEDHVDL